MGFGDSAIDFELRAWAEVAIWVQVQSALNAAVCEAVDAAGMSFAYPLRVVELMRDPRTAPVMTPPEQAMGTIKVRRNGNKYLSEM